MNIVKPQKDIGSKSEELFSIPQDINVFFQTENAVLKEKILNLEAEISAIKEENKRLKRDLYGQKSERHNSSSNSKEIPPEDRIINEPESFSQGAEAHKDEAQEEEDSKEPPSKNQNKKNKKHKKHRAPGGGKKSFSAHLPRDEVIHDLEECKKFCPSDNMLMRLMSQETVEKIEIVPQKIKVIRHTYNIYSCPCCQYVTQVPSVPSVIPKGQCEPGLLAKIVENKYSYGLPLYRQEEMLRQIGIDFTRHTLARWMIISGMFLKPLFELMKEYILSQSIVHADETTVQVLKKTNKKEPKSEEKKDTSSSYMWLACTGAWAPSCVVFEYHPNRTQESAKNLLGNFKGYLQVDGYGGYNAIAAQEDVIRVGCWAHVRRKFETAMVVSTPGASLAEVYIEKIKLLFMCERKFLNLTAEKRLEKRKENSAPIVEDIRKSLTAAMPQVTPTSKLGLALRYMDNEWDGLVRFLENGDVSISNNRIENFVRPFAIGRKNWLFCDTVAGAHASSVLYSIVVSAKANGLDTFQYLDTLLRDLPRILKDNPKADLAPYLPHVWKPPSPPLL